MNLLSIDSSSKAASCALLSDEKLLGECYLNAGLTHSQTLMPMVQSLFSLAGLAPSQIDRVAVSRGPGSFTGLRIGLASAKALAVGCGAPIGCVSTLRGIAYNLRGFEGTCCAVLDARCQQVYYALFALHAGEVHRLSDDAAAPLDEALGKLFSTKGEIYLAGDGAALCHREAMKLPNASHIHLAPGHLLLQRASSVGYAALRQGHWMDPAAAVPSYLRLSQAEREYRQKQEEKR